MVAAPIKESNRTCLGCGASTAKGPERCPRCGRNAGHPYHWPHCRIEVDLVRSKTLGFACAICGRAGIPVDDPKVERTYAELPSLERANRFRITRLVWRGGAWAALGLSLVMLLIAALVAVVFDPQAPVVVLSALGFLIPLGMALFAFRRARKTDAALLDALDEARRTVALEVARAQGDFDPERLGEVMRLDASTTRRLAAGLLGDPAALELMERQRWRRLESRHPRARVDGAPLLATEREHSGSMVEKKKP